LNYFSRRNLVSTTALLLLVFDLFFDHISATPIYAYETITKKYTFNTGFGHLQKSYNIIVDIPTQTYDYYSSASHPWGVIKYYGSYEFHLSKYIVPESVGNIPQIIASYTDGGKKKLQTRS